MERPGDSSSVVSHLALRRIPGRGQSRTPRRLHQGAATGHGARRSDRIQLCLRKYCLSVACRRTSPLKRAHGCVDAEDAAAAAAWGWFVVMGCWFSSDMMDAAHYAADRTLLVQQKTPPDTPSQHLTGAEIKKTSQRSSSAEITA